MADKQQLEQMMELSNRAEELRRHMGQIGAQIHGAQQKRAAMAASLAHIERLSDPTPLYRPMGKAYLMSTAVDLKDDFENELSKTGTELEGRTALRDQFVVKLRECEAQIDELAEQFSKAQEAVKI